MTLEQLLAAINASGITAAELTALLKNLKNESVINQLKLKRDALLIERQKAMADLNKPLEDLDKEIAVQTAAINEAAKV